MFGKIRHHKVCGERDEAGENTFEDKDPTPSMIASYVVHLADGGSEQTAKSARKLCGGKEESESLLSLCSFVPHADQVETYIGGM